jgi:hypothetical protein
MRRFLFTAVIATFIVSCSTGAVGCGGCAGFTPLPQGSYQGPKLDSAGAARLTVNGFQYLNQNSAQILSLFAGDGGVLTVPIPCSIQNVNIGAIPATKLAIGDTGTAGCTTAACGRLDGICDSRDVGQSLTIAISSLTFAPAAPDIVEATITATIQTGLLPMGEVSPSLLCLFNGRAQCTLDLDTTSQPPTKNALSLNIRLAIDQRWDKLLSLQVASVGGMQACTGAADGGCLDPNDIVIANEGGCGACTTFNSSLVKALIVGQLTSTLTTKINDALAGANCAPCGVGGACPSTSVATSRCDLDAGVCLDTSTGVCVPGLLGVEGRIDIGTVLGGLGAPAGSAMELSIGVGGSAEATDAGATLGLRGGAQELNVASCVEQRTWTAPPALPLPDFDLDAPAPYDLGLSVSGQFLSELLFRAQQSGALCIELHQDTVSALESSLLATLLPSVGKLTHGDDVPLEIVIRPVNPPTATVGAGTIDAATGKIIDPLLRLSWQGVQIDAYARLEDRMARLFTLGADLDLPLGVALDGCSGVTPVIGDLTGAVTNVTVTNSEMVAEPLDALKALVPSLLTLAEPTLASGLTKFTLPAVQGFNLKLVGAHGVGLVAGTSTYNHAGVYAQLQPASMTCVPTHRTPTHRAKLVSTKGTVAELQLPTSTSWAFRVDGGFWSTWRTADSTGVAKITHPRLLLGGAHRIELRYGDGGEETIVTGAR